MIHDSKFLNKITIVLEKNNKFLNKICVVLNAMVCHFVAVSHIMFFPQGVASLAESLPANHRLERLYLGYNNINEAGAVFLLHKVARNRSLLLLEVSGNMLGTTRSFAALKLMMVHSSLKSLVVAYTSITDEGAIALAEALAENKRLFELDVTGNSLKCPGLLAFSLTMRINKTLGRLRFDAPAERKDRMEYALSLARQIEASCLYNSEHCVPMGPVASRAEYSKSDHAPSAVLHINPIKGLLMESFCTLDDIDDETREDDVLEEVPLKLVAVAPDSSVNSSTSLQSPTASTIFAELSNGIPLAAISQSLEGKEIAEIASMVQNQSLNSNAEALLLFDGGTCVKYAEAASPTATAKPTADGDCDEATADEDSAETISLAVCAGVYTGGKLRSTDAVAEVYRSPVSLFEGLLLLLFGLILSL